MIDYSKHIKKLSESVRATIRVVPDFPKDGIQFKDISPLLADHNMMDDVVDWVWSDPAARYAGVIVGLDARGFLFGMPAAMETETSFVMCRKAGKLPGECESVSYDLEYGSATVEIQKDAFLPGTSVRIIDDLLATGGTAMAAVELVRKLGGTVSECVFITELGYLDGRKKLEDAGVAVRSLVIYEE